MRDEGKRDFDKAALTWDEDPNRVRMAQAIVEAIKREVALSPDQDAMDYGAGTGLVTLGLQPYLRTITAADSSPGMLAVLEKKLAAHGVTNVRTLPLDLEKERGPEAAFDLIVAAMTLHHIKDVGGILSAFHRMLKPGGTVALADLDTEDGSFHGDKTGVLHFGFDRERMGALLRQAGFDGAKAVTAATVPKGIEAGVTREYTVFLITARKAERP